MYEEEIYQEFISSFAEREKKKWKKTVVNYCKLQCRRLHKKSSAVLIINTLFVFFIVYEDQFFGCVFFFWIGYIICWLLLGVL